MSTATNVLDKICAEFERSSGLHGVKRELVTKRQGQVLVLDVAYPTERLYKLLEDARKDAVPEGEEPPLVTLRHKRGANLLDGPEGKLLLRTLSESQNINRYSFESDFMARYTRSVTGAESQIIATANHVVLGRRGAGKSMLLLYAWHDRKIEGKPSVWIDMQVYSGRGDTAVISDILKEILEQTSALLREAEAHRALITKLNDINLSESQIRKILPEIRRLLGRFATSGMDLFLFLDDFHVVNKELQPTLLDAIYAISRGNRIYIKISAIETLTRTYDPSTQTGIAIPQDAQNIRLDYNLTTPDKTTKHIEAILNSHAMYAGIRSVRTLCTSANVIPRLTWVAAGVPRDALYLFSQAITKASMSGAKRVSVSNVNVAASETLTIKLRDLETDASQRSDELRETLEEIREFCVTTNRKNAFLVEMGRDQELYERVMNLVHLRLLHVISEGITVGVAGRKYLGLILDYGFYTGIRAAQSVDLFNQQSDKVSYKELRKLPVFTQ